MILPLQKELDHLKDYMEKGDLLAPSVSSKGIYWHVDHCLRIIESVPIAMASSIEEEYRPKSNLIKFVIMNFGWIPRGKGKAPKYVMPDEDQLDLDSIKKRFEEASSQLALTSTLPEWAHFKHPLFGSLKKDQALKFLKIHTHHHIKIMRDIVKEH